MIEKQNYEMTNTYRARARKRLTYIVRDITIRAYGKRENRNNSE